MWSDGYFNPHAWDKYGFDEYQLKHCCFGGDGDEQGEATGGDPGDADDFYEDDTPVTPDDYSGLEDAYADTLIPTRGGGRAAELANVGRKGPMTDAEIGRAMGQAQATSVATNPYTDMIAHGIIANPNISGSPGLMPSEMGFIPQYGYDVFTGSGTGPVNITKADPLNPLTWWDPERGTLKTNPSATITPYNPSKISREDLGKSYSDAYEGSQDLGSGIASLFGFKSPVEFDPEKGFYEGTTFDPFDAPLISGALSLLSPPLGALYGLTKGVVKGDPVGGALSMIGPFSPLRPAVDAAGNILNAANIWTGGNTTFSNLAGFGTPVSNKYGTGPAPYSFMGERIDPTISIDRTSIDPISNPFDTLVDFKDDVLDYGRNMFNDPTAGAVPFNASQIVGPFPTSNPQLSPQHLEGLGLGAQQAVKDAMLDIGREERANAVLGIEPLPMAPIPVRKGGVREAQQVVKDALYNY